MTSNEKELDELDSLKAKLQLLTKLNEAKLSICDEGTISADDLEKELGLGVIKKRDYN